MGCLLRVNWRARPLSPRVIFQNDNTGSFTQELIIMAPLTTIGDYLRVHGAALGERVLGQFPPLHEPSDPVSPALKQLKRRPFPAQALAIMGIAKRWEEARCAAAVAECGTGKTLISLGSVFTHADGRAFTTL